MKLRQIERVEVSKMAQGIGYEQSCAGCRAMQAGAGAYLLYLAGAMVRGRGTYRVGNREVSRDEFHAALRRARNATEP